MHPDLAHGWRCMVCGANRAFHETGIAYRPLGGHEDIQVNVQFCLDRDACVAHATADGPWRPPTACVITPGCEHGPHPIDAHPCGKKVRPGAPCEFCGDPTAVDEQGQPVPCPKCWVSLEGRHLADIKGILALGGLSASPAQEDQPE